MTAKRATSTDTSAAEPWPPTTSETLMPQPMPERVEVPWRGYRLVPSVFPPVGLFDEVADDDEMAVVLALHVLTNPRIREELGQLEQIPRDDRVYGPGSTPVMAAFCYPNPSGSRFSDGRFGVYYAASALAAAAAEVAYHRERFYASTRAPAQRFVMRAYVNEWAASMHDLREVDDRIHDPDHHGAAHRWADRCRAEGSDGVLYRSVRSPGAECVAAFRPAAVKVPVTQAAHIELCWDGQRVTHWYELGQAVPLRVI